MPTNNDNSSAVFELRVTPHGVIVPVPPSGKESQWAQELRATFTEAEPAGLFALAAAPLPSEASSALTYWRDLPAEVLRLIRVLGSSGGYMAAASNAVQPDVPIDNILALYRTAREYKYPSNPPARPELA